MKNTYKKFYTNILLLVILQSIIMMAGPILIAIWQNDKLTTKKIIILGLVFIVGLLVNLLLINSREKYAKHYNVSNFLNIFDKFLKLDYKTMIKEGNTNLVERIIISVNSIYSYMTGDNIRLITSYLIVFISLLMILFKDFFVFLILCAVVLINIMGYRHINEKLEKNSQDMQEITSKSWQKILSLVKNPDFVKAQDSYEGFVKMANGPVMDAYSSIADLNIYAQSASTIINSLNNIVKTMLLIFIFMTSIPENLKLNMLFFTIIIPIFFSSLSCITGINVSKVDFKVSNSFIDFLNNNKENIQGKEIKKVDKLKLDLNEVTLNDKASIKYEINEEFTKGDVVWVKGESGRGKSSLFKSMLGFYKANKILINGTSIEEIDKNNLRKIVSYIPQEATIFNYSLKDNILMNKNKETEEDNKWILDSLLKYKNLDEEISENASNISGGEKQKIAIARAMLEEPEVLILDEVVSNIDKKSAEDILDALLLNKSEMIIFIISHDELDEKYYNRVLNV